MKMNAIEILWIFLAVETCIGLEPSNPIDCSEDQLGVPENQPLFLTPLIEAGRLDEAKSLSRVGSLGPVEDVPSYAGLLTVQREMNSNMFFWFFPAKENPESAPVVLWLQGGPGSSCMFSIFVEHGPFVISDDGIPQLRKFTWTRPFSMLYVDNPVGTGYSFTGMEQGYATNQTDVGRDMLETLQQFFTLFHELADNEFYLAGESYGGKYVPAVAYAIHTAIQPRIRINLKGISIGDGLVDPVSMIDYGDYLYQIGLADRNQAAIFRQLGDKAKRLIENERYGEAVRIIDSVIICAANVTCYFKQVAGIDTFNFMYNKSPKHFKKFAEFVQTPVVRDAIHVGDLPFNDGSMAVATHLFVDLAKSVKPWLAALMEEYKVLIYNGQLDVIIPYTHTVNMISTIAWSGAKAFSDAPRKIWLSPDGQDIAGYVRQVGNFTEVLVRSAGHFVPYDQPEVALDMITRFVRGGDFAP